MDWLAVFDLDTKESFGSILIPDGLNVPPSLVKVQPHKNSLPNCVQLHKDLQISWEVFGPQITIELSGQVNEEEYMAFGISGSTEKSQMIGADVTVAYIDGYRGFAVDYNITALAPVITYFKYLFFFVKCESLEQVNGLCIWEVFSWEKFCFCNLSSLKCTECICRIK